MAQLYIDGGPEKGNAYMGQFDNASENLQNELRPLVVKIFDQKKIALKNVENDLKKLSNLSILFSFALIFLVVSILYLFAKWLTDKSSKETEKLEETVELLSKSTTELDEISKSLTDSNTVQLESLEKTISFSKEIESLAMKNLNMAKEADVLSKDSSKAGNQGLNGMNNLLRAMTRIVDSNSEVSEEIASSNLEISKIVEMIATINTKTKVINEIAAQTKMLSFNASVEAERAGAHGKGFAIVAEEVGVLAALSGKASVEISAMINESLAQMKELFEETKRTTDLKLDLGKKTVSEGIELAEECKVALENILEKISKVDRMIAEIGDSALAQSDGLKMINLEAGKLDNMSNSNSGLIETCVSVSKRLVGQSSQISETAKTFKELVRK